MEIQVEKSLSKIKEQKISITELFFLELVKKLGEPIAVKDVMPHIKEANMKQDTVYRILKKLEKKGLIKYKSNLTPPDSLYLIISEPSKLLKIGISSNPLKRAKDISLASTLPTKVLYSFNGLSHLEKELKLKYKNLNIGGEWFNYSEEIVKEFQNLKNSTTNE
jgi:hypothetical protein